MCIRDRYLEPENLRLRVEKTMNQLRDWVATKNAEDLFFEAQERHMPYGLVLPIEQVAENPQLIARDWFVPYQIGEHKILSTGAPYHFSDTPWQLGEYKSINEDQVDILNEIGWNS